ncbi:MAG: LytTR family transcriptional regulator [Bacteroidales bacterium]|nr:LytTR family transcriptional regulator [Bacteroidales bacterium]MBN2820244.1 LytTR family transcriptional regulator [Bacteroidales bacterium]
MTTINKTEQFLNLTKRYIKTYLTLAIAILLFIQFFQPFSFEKFDFDNLYLFIGGFGMIALIMLLIVQVLFHNQLLQLTDELSATPFYLLLYSITLVVANSIAFLFYLRYVGQLNINFNIAVRVVFISISMPILLNLKSKLAFYTNRIKKLLSENRELQEKLKQFSDNYANKYVELISESDSDNFIILVSDIVYAKSADNYVEIGYLDDGETKKKMIRNTLRNIEQQLREFNNFIRTHRTSIVNIQYIKELNKNFNSYWLSLDFSKETIPVSRQYLMTVKEVI